MQRTKHSLIKNSKERKKVAFFWKECLPNPGFCPKLTGLEIRLSVLWANCSFYVSKRVIRSSWLRKEGRKKFTLDHKKGGKLWKTFKRYEIYVFFCASLLGLIVPGRLFQDLTFQSCSSRIDRSIVALPGLIVPGWLYYRIDRSRAALLGLSVPGWLF